MKKLIILLIIFLLINITPAIAQTDNYEKTDDLPSYFNWRDIDGIDYTTSVKTQGLCPSCEAYGLVASIETIMRYKFGTDFDADLSEAHLFFYPGGTCRWGVNVTHAADYLIKIGVPDEGCFPDPLRLYDPEYKSVEGWENRTVKISEWGWIENDVDAIKRALIRYGPLIICFWVYGSFYDYKRGVYRPKEDEPISGGHLVALVGYDDSKQCWILKNSWGYQWGNKGWFKMAYEPNMFIDGCYGGTGIMYIDGLYGNFMPDVPKIYIERPRRMYTYFRRIEFKTLIKGIDYIKGDIARIIGWTKIKLDVENAVKVDFYLDGRLAHTDFHEPFEWTLRAPIGRHEIQASAYDSNGNESRAMKDIFVLL